MTTPLNKLLTSWDRKLIIKAKEWAVLSKDPNTQCGAFIVDFQRRPLGAGYNGFPRGIKDTPDRLNNRELKNQLMVHAERNAIYNCSIRPTNGILYLWTSSSCSACVNCVQTIIQQDINKVVMPVNINPKWQESCELGLSLLWEAEVLVQLYDLEEFR